MRYYFLPAGKKHAPVPPGSIPELAAMPQETNGFSVLSIPVWIGPSGDDWHEQKGRSVRYIPEWLNRQFLRFPDDPDRIYYLRGWYPEPSIADEPW